MKIFLYILNLFTPINPTPQPVKGIQSWDSIPKKRGSNAKRV